MNVLNNCKQDALRRS